MSKYPFLSTALLIAGIAIGAGELGIPLALAGAGYIPALFGTLVVYLCMLASGILTARLFLRTHVEDLPSLFRQHLGIGWAAIFNGSYFALAFCLLVAYWSGLFNLLGGGCYAFGTLLFCGGILLWGMGKKFHFLGRVNGLLTVVMGMMFFLLITIGFSCKGSGLSSFHSWSQLPKGLPVILCSFGYHQVIPLLCKQLHRNKRMVNWALILGTFIPLLFTFAIFTLAFHLFSSEELLLAAKQGLPMFALLREHAFSHRIFLLGRCFSILAITTSIIGISLAMRGAIGDVMKGSKAFFKTDKWLVLIPIPVALLYPRLFLVILGLCGGIFGNIISGIIPLTPFLKIGHFHLRYLIIWSIFVSIFFIELKQLIWSLFF
ncbi:MAG: hypothetical protein LBG86_01045 [Puniceicoccales bacterium]|jgi:tyrosine-specific transport protein|nr:hypothetical protein [Puniceicoccales bacterium]